MKGFKNDVAHCKKKTGTCERKNAYKINEILKIRQKEEKNTFCDTAKVSIKPTKY